MSSDAKQKNSKNKRTNEQMQSTSDHPTDQNPSKETHTQPTITGEPYIRSALNLTETNGSCPEMVRHQGFWFSVKWSIRSPRNPDIVTSPQKTLTSTVQGMAETFNISFAMSFPKYLHKN